MPHRTAIFGLCLGSALAIWALLSNCARERETPLPTQIVGAVHGPPLSQSVMVPESPEARAYEEIPLQALRSLRFQGMLRDRGGQAIAGGRVRVCADGASTTAPETVVGDHRAITDGAGSFAMDLPATSALHTVTAEAPGFSRGQLRIRLPGRRVELTLDRAHPWRGRVLSAEGLPIEGALVRWKRPGEEAEAVDSTRSKPDGTFALEDSPPDLQLEVSKAGYESSWQFAHAVQSAELIEVRLLEQVVRGGRVVSGVDNRGLAGVSIEVWHDDGEPGARGFAAACLARLTSDDEGRFSFPDSAGNRPADSSAIRGLWVHSPDWSPCFIDLGGAACDSELTVMLFPCATVKGRVIDHRGAPVRGLRVWAESELQALRPSIHRAAALAPRRVLLVPELLAFLAAPGDLPFLGVHEAITGDDGRYEIPGLPCTASGTQLGISLVGMSPPRVKAIGFSGQVAVAPDLIAGADYRLVSIRGVVVDENDRPQAGARLQAGAMNHTSTNELGEFELQVTRRSSSGQLRCTAPGFLTRILDYPEEGVSDLRIKLVPARDLRLCVRDAAGRPIPRVWLTARSPVDAGSSATERSPIASGMTDSSGFAVLTGLPNLVIVRARVGGVGESELCYEREIHLAITERADWEIPVAVVGTSPQDLTIELVEDGAPGVAHSARVELAQSGATVRSAEGVGPKLRIGRLYPGSYEARIAVQGYAILERSIEIGDAEADLKIVLPPGDALTGQVSGPPESERSGIAIAIRDSNRRVCATAITNSSGEFHIRGLAPGGYVASAGHSAAGAQAWASPRSVAFHYRQASASLDIPLSRFDRMKGVLPWPESMERALRSGRSLSPAQRAEVSRRLIVAVEDQTGSPIESDLPLNDEVGGFGFTLSIPRGRYWVSVGWRGGSPPARYAVESNHEMRLSIPTAEEMPNRD